MSGTCSTLDYEHTCSFCFAASMPYFTPEERVNCWSVDQAPATTCGRRQVLVGRCSEFNSVHCSRACHLAGFASAEFT